MMIESAGFDDQAKEHPPVMRNPTIPVRDDQSQFETNERPQLFLKLLQEIGVAYEGKRVVDLGAGFGSIAIALAQHGAKVTAVDAGDHQISVLRRRAEVGGVPIDARVANLLTRLDAVADADLALMVGVVEYAGLWSDVESVEDLQVRVFRTALSTLRPGCDLVLATKNRLWPVFAVRDVHTKLPLVNVLPRALAESLAKSRTGMPYRLYIHSPRKWQALLREAGFSHTEVFYPYLSYQFPIGVSRKPVFSDISSLPRPSGRSVADAATHGRVWKLKVVAMALAHKVGIPLSQSVVIKATK